MPERVSEPLPLAGYERLHSTDVDETREAVAAAFCPHGLFPVQRRPAFEARFHSVRLGDVGLNYLDYGDAVRIAPGQLEDFFLVQLPLSGSAEITCGDRHIVSHPGLASVPAPDRMLSMRWGAGNPQLIVWIDRERLENHLRTLLDHPVTEPLRFELGMDTTACRPWLNVVALLRGEVERGGEPLAQHELERLLMSRLLLAQPNNYSAALHRRAPEAAPRVVRAAVELIEAHAAERLTVEDIAEAVGISVRALQEGFRRTLDSTPTGYLREVRLQRVRAALAAADPRTAGVTDIALRWGFVHQGRFSVQYRQRFGESPSVTLRR
ncbi:AraC family transcriptional regulator [Sciscionella sediminilitoris]|uniref:AraC family transcriptional regulator n=1 Tax=Sciscionella sediminilitoris TaxID=1445613 RepID=UPI0004DF9069|nr:AraC family transcriptional regulator [Sciscionella sp. SE31]